MTEEVTKLGVGVFAVAAVVVAAMKANTADRTTKVRLALLETIDVADMPLPSKRKLP